MPDFKPHFFYYPVWLLKYRRPNGNVGYVFHPGDADALLIFRTEEEVKVYAEGSESQEPGADLYPIPVASPGELAALLGWLDRAKAAVRYVLLPGEDAGEVRTLIAASEEEHARSHPAAGGDPS